VRRIYIDEDAMSDALAAALRAFGFDVETAQGAGMRGRADPDHLRLAADTQRVLYSYNRRDFLRIHAQWLGAGIHHAGIVLLGERATGIGEQRRRIVELLDARGVSGMRDYLQVV